MELDIKISPEQELQAQKFAKRKLTSNVYQLCPDPNQRNEKPDAEIVLFHGLQMPGSEPAHSLWRTWKMRYGEECWLETLLPQMLIDNLGRQYRARVLSVQYEGRPRPGADVADASDSRLVVDSLIQELITEHVVDVGQTDGVPVILVGHDLGGILIKDFVIQAEYEGSTECDDERRKKLERFLTNLKSVFFYATPHSGASVLERMGDSIPSDQRHKMLSFLRVLDADKSRVNSAFETFRKGDPSLKRSRFTSHAIHATHHTEVKSYGKGLIVSEASARSNMDTFFSVAANHFEVCQPDNDVYTPAQKLAGEIFRLVKERKAVQQPPSSEEVRDRRKAFLSSLATKTPAANRSNSESAAAGEDFVYCTSSTNGPTAAIPR